MRELIWYYRPHDGPETLRAVAVSETIQSVIIANVQEKIADDVAVLKAGIFTVVLGAIALLLLARPASSQSTDSGARFLSQDELRQCDCPYDPNLCNLVESLDPNLDWCEVVEANRLSRLRAFASTWLDVQGGDPGITQTYSVLHVAAFRYDPGPVDNCPTSKILWSGTWEVARDLSRMTFTLPAVPEAQSWSLSVREMTTVIRDPNLDYVDWRDYAKEFGVETQTDP